MEGFLNKKYPDLTGSKPVERAVEKAKKDPERVFAPHTRDERIEAYLDRLDYIIKDERGWRRLKQKLVNEFTIDVHDEDIMMHIANGLYESEKRIATEQGRGADIAHIAYDDDLIEKYHEAIHEKRDIQERTLSAWLDYLEQNDAQYPTWFRYFVVRNLEKMGNLNKEKGEYSKRNDHTIAPFPELNSEALGFVYRMLVTGVGHQEFLDAPEKRETLTALIEKKDFIKLYAFAQIETAGALNREHIEGEWVKYERGSDHHTLEDALRMKGTGWCTAEGSARAHLEHGDFYVYFTRGIKGTYSEPRVAIRMENGEVAEVRGVNYRQELEPALVDIATEKYHALPGGEKFDKKSSDMKHMTTLVHKQEKNEVFTIDDLRFLYELDSIIKGFGYRKDLRIAELKDRRNRAEDIRTICNCTPEELATDFLAFTDATRVFAEDTGDKIIIIDFREDKHKSKLPQLIELAKAISETGCAARPDMSFEGGIISVEISQKLREQLKDWKTAQNAYTEIDIAPASISNKLKQIQWQPPTTESLNILVVNPQPNSRLTFSHRRNVLVSEMDKMGYRPLMLSELTALGIAKPHLTKYDGLLASYEKHGLFNKIWVPFIVWDRNNKRYLETLEETVEWDDSYRLLFIRKNSSDIKGQGSFFRKLIS